MVKRLTLWILRFYRSEDGTSLVEGLLVFPLVLLTFSAFIEFTFAMYQWNQTVKAIQFGARKAAVLNPVVADYTATMSADLGGAEGGPMPSTIVEMTCDGETLTTVALRG